MNVKREDIEQGRIEEVLIEAERQGLMRRMPPAERQASKRRVLAELGAGEDVWVFAYGSLMWNPCIHYIDRRPALIHGYHRSFCMWTPLGRGSPENPGLMLGLDNGGSCRGVAFRIAACEVEEELDIVWPREMVAGSYDPRWVTVRTDLGAVRAVTFVMDHENERYAGRLPVTTIVRHLATAGGRLGTAFDYLEATVAHLDELGIDDGPMHALLERVHA